jgi:hypothetical protein
VRPGNPGVIEVQKAYYARQMPREAALATAAIVYGYSPEEAGRLFPPAEFPQPVQGPTA